MTAQLGKTAGFDPLTPLLRPPTWRELVPRASIWGMAELARFRRDRTPLPSLVAVAADALLQDPTVVEELLAAECSELFLDAHTLGAEGDRREAGLTALVEALQAGGVRVFAGFTLGLDHDEVGCFERLVAWVEARRLCGVELRLWVPEPGSEQFRVLARADRIVHRQLRCWDGAHVVVTPARMSPQVLYRGWVWAQQRLASPGSIWRRRPLDPAVWPAFLLALLRFHRGRMWGARSTWASLPSPGGSGVLPA